MEKQTVPISSLEPDYYNWGRNCAYLGYDEQISENCLNAYDPPSTENYDWFWMGYFDNKDIENTGNVVSILG